MRQSPTLMLKLPGSASQLICPAMLPPHHPLQFRRTRLLPHLNCQLLPSHFLLLCLGWPQRGELENLEKHCRIPSGWASQDGEGDLLASSSNRWSSVT